MKPLHFIAFSVSSLKAGIVAVYVVRNTAIVTHDPVGSARASRTWDTLEVELALIRAQNRPTESALDWLIDRVGSPATSLRSNASLTLNWAHSLEAFFNKAKQTPGIFFQLYRWSRFQIRSMTGTLALIFIFNAVSFRSWPLSLLELRKTIRKTRSKRLRSRRMLPIRSRRRPMKSTARKHRPRLLRLCMLLKEWLRRRVRYAVLLPFVEAHHLLHWFCCFLDFR